MTSRQNRLYNVRMRENNETLLAVAQWVGTETFSENFMSQIIN